MCFCSIARFFINWIYYNIKPKLLIKSLKCIGALHLIVPYIYVSISVTITMIIIIVIGYNNLVSYLHSWVQRITVCHDANAFRNAYIIILYHNINIVQHRILDRMELQLSISTCFLYM